MLPALFSVVAERPQRPLRATPAEAAQRWQNHASVSRSGTGVPYNPVVSLLRGEVRPPPPVASQPFQLAGILRALSRISVRDPDWAELLAGDFVLLSLRASYGQSERLWPALVSHCYPVGRGSRLVVMRRFVPESYSVACKSSRESATPRPSSAIASRPAQVLPRRDQDCVFASNKLPAPACSRRVRDGDATPPPLQPDPQPCA